MAPRKVKDLSVWGVGVVLWEMITGDDECTDEHRYEQIERRISPIRSYRRVPAIFASLVEGCMQPDLARRPTVKELMPGFSSLAQNGS